MATSTRAPSNARRGAQWRLVRAAGGRRPRRALLLGMLAAVLATGLGAWVVLGTSVFGVSEVTVRGATFVDADEVRQAADVTEGTALARVDLDKVSRSVAQLAPVASVRVSRDWPDTLVISITERTPRLAVPDGDEYLLIDDAGVPYRIVATVPRDAVVADIATPQPADRATQEVLAVLAALPQQLRDQLERIDAGSPAGITLELHDGRSIMWGDSSDSPHKAEVAMMLLEMRSEEHIDVSAPDVPTVR